MWLQVIQAKEGQQGSLDVQYTCRCSFLQIYQEHISDLLRPHAPHGHGDEGRSLPLRTHPDSGVFVEGLSEHVIVNGAPRLPSAGDAHWTGCNACPRVLCRPR